MEFFAGIYLAKYIKKNNLIEYQKPVFTVIGAMLIVVSIVIIFPTLQSTTQHYSIQTNIGFIYNSFIFPFIVALFFYGLITEQSLLNRLLSSKSFIILGKSSYSLYLVHWGMTSYIIHRFVGTNFLVEIVLTYILSIVIWKYFEEPANIFIRTKHNKQTNF